MPSLTTGNPQLLMMLAGIGLLCWLMVRSRMTRRATAPRSAPTTATTASTAKLKYNSQAQIRPANFAGTGSVNAPADALQWQLDLHDLGRELKAELDCKLIAGRRMTQDYDRASRRLLALIRAAEHAQAPEQGILSRIQSRHAEGWSSGQIANEIGLSETDVLELIPISSSLPSRSESTA